MSYEPQLDDPIALGMYDTCDDCEQEGCSCGEPDVMYEDFYED
jgi:hypothetical protein